MRKLLLFTSALLCAASMWAATPQTEGPWTMLTMKSGSCDRDLNSHISFNQLGYNHWGTLRFWNDEDGIGYTLEGSSTKLSKNMVFLIAYRDESVPAYTRKVLTWTFVLKSRNKKHHSTTSLYARDNVNDLMAMAVDFTEKYDDKAGQEYMLAQLMNHADEGDTKKTSDPYTKTFEFDNRNGSDAAVKSWYLMLAHVVRSGDSGKSDLHEWGSFIHVSESWTTWYYRYITYDANGGTGSMANQTIENSGNLTANAFTRNGYTFQGWAKTPDGEKVYDDGAAVAATEYSKGPVTFYAIWTPTVAYVEALINAIGEVSYPGSEAAIDAARAAYNMLSEEDQALVSNYSTLTTAESDYAQKETRAGAIADVEDKIAVIPAPVEKTSECHDAIQAAEEAYLALSNDEKAQISATDLEKLRDASDAFAVLDGQHIIRFVDKDDATIRDYVFSLDVPDAPEISGFTFQYWQAVAGEIAGNIIRIQAVYAENPPTDIDETTVNGQSSNRKLIKDGNLYILKDEFIYTINGQKIQ